MKNLFIIFIALTVFASCDENPAKTTSNKPTINIIKNSAPSTTATNQEYIIYTISGDKKIKFAPIGDDNETTRSVGAMAMLRRPYESINSALLKSKLSKNFILKCSACHDDYANGIIGPSLLDKNKGQIFTMIKAYKDKTKANVLMRELVMNMSDEEIDMLAKEIDLFNEPNRIKR